MVVKANERNIETDIFYKKINAHGYVYFESAHPRKTKRNTPFTLAQRITRIVSNPIQQEQRLQELIGVEFQATDRSLGPLLNLSQAAGWDHL